MALSMARTPTRIPSALNEEDPFFLSSVFRLSLRQVITLLAGFGLWWLLGTQVGSIVGSQLLGLLIFGWMPILALALTFIKRRGRPLEQWVADRVAFAITTRHYALVERRDGREQAEDAYWEDEPW